MPCHPLSDLKSLQTLKVRQGKTFREILRRESRRAELHRPDGWKLLQERNDLTLYPLVCPDAEFREVGNVQVVKEASVRASGVAGDGESERLELENGAFALDELDIGG